MNGEELEKLENIVSISNIPQWKSIKKKSVIYGVGSVLFGIGCMAGYFGFNESLLLVPAGVSLFYAEKKYSDYEIAKDELKSRERKAIQNNYGLKPRECKDFDKFLNNQAV